MSDDAAAKAERAHRTIRELCHGDRKWVMSVPARRDYDPDLIISDALIALEAKVAALEAGWEALDDLQGRLWCALGQPLGVEYVQAVRNMKNRNEALEAENGRLRAERRATLEAVIDECSAEKVYAITGRMLTAYRAQQPSPAQDEEQG